LCRLGLVRRALVLVGLARGLALTNKPVLDCITDGFYTSAGLGLDVIPHSRNFQVVPSLIAGSMFVGTGPSLDLDEANTS
jgi:hypothetical protein